MKEEITVEEIVGKLKIEKPQYKYTLEFEMVLVTVKRVRVRWMGG